MAFLRLPASMLLLASFILLLYGTTSSADQSHDLLAKRSHDLPLAKRSHDLPLAKRALAFPAKRVKRSEPMDPDTRERVAASLEGVKELVSFTTETTTEVLSHSKELVKVFESLSSFGKLLPGFLGVAFSFVNLALAFVPQDDPLQKGFDELSRKLDSLSLQVSDLSMDVEWFNYASVYTQDVVRILNAWKKYNEFRKNVESEQSIEGKLHLAKIFTTYYKDSGTVGCMNNLYHYLTVSEMLLSGNLNDLLTRKYKCSVRDITRYNKYFSSLLLKGMVLNQLYWKLIGLHRPAKVDEHQQMLTDVYSKQKAVLRNCLDNSEEYMKKDVVEITKVMDPADKKAIAEEVKKALDKKYFWYDWVVVVYDSSQKDNHKFYDMTTVDVGTISVTVGYILTAEQDKKANVLSMLGYVINKQRSNANPETDLRSCKMYNIYIAWELMDGVPLNEFLKVTQSSYNEDYQRVPEPLKILDCRIDGSWYKTSLYFSRSGPACSEDSCANGGECVPLLKSNEHVCECPGGFYGNTCEKEINIDIPEIDERLVHKLCFNTN